MRPGGALASMVQGGIGQEPGGPGEYRATTRKQGRAMAVKEIFAGLPWWVKWVAVPVILLVVFGGLIGSVVGFLVGLLFKILLAVALIAGVVYLVRRFTGSSS